MFMVSDTIKKLTVFVDFPSEAGKEFLLVDGLADAVVHSCFGAFCHGLLSYVGCYGYDRYGLRVGALEVTY